MRSWLPTASATPPRLEATVERRHLRRLFAPVAAVDGPTELAVADDGLVAASVDDAVVTAVQATLHRTLCDRYDAAPGTVSVDATALADVLAAEPDDAPATLVCDPDEETLSLELSAFAHTRAVSGDASVELPDVDDPPRGATTYHHSDALADALDYFADRTDVVALGYDEVADVFYVEPATTASATATADTRYRRPRDDLPGPVTPGPARSAFGVDALSAILETVPPETVVRLDHAEAFPARFAWDLAAGDGVREGTLTEVTAVVAPRQTPGTTPAEE